MSEPGIHCPVHAPERIAAPLHDTGIARPARAFAIVLAAALSSPAFAQPGTAGAAEGTANGLECRSGASSYFRSVELGEGPWEFDAQRQRIRVSVVARDLMNPWALAFLPNGDMLVTERHACLRVIRNGTLDPQPISGLPEIHARGLGGLMDVALHPDFDDNRLVYFAYSRPGEHGATTAVARARFDGGHSLRDLEDVIVTDAWHSGTGAADGSFGSRIVFDDDAFLYVTVGERNVADKAQDPGSHLGKTLRVHDDGSAPADNPFVGRPGYKPEIFTLGHRNQQGLAFHPDTGALWSHEHGPQGGDRLDILKAGSNYGWPLVSLGYNYDGTRVGDGFQRPDVEPPVVFWVPSIAPSGLMIYGGDRFPSWRGNAFVGVMRFSAQPNSGHMQRVNFNSDGLPTGREPLLAELRQRVRDIREGPDGLIYVLTDEPDGALLKVEPVE